MIHSKHLCTDRVDPQFRSNDVARRLTWACVSLLLVLFACLISASCNRQSGAQVAQNELEKARASIRSGRLEEAIIEYRRAIQAAPKLSVSHFELGEVYVQKEDYIGGAQQLNIAVRLDPSNDDARLALANIFLLAKSYREAKEQSDAVLLQHPASSKALLVGARASLGMGEPMDASAAVEQVLRTEPTNADAWLIRATQEFEEKHYSASEDSFRKSLQYDPHKLTSTAAFSALLLKENKTTEAETVIRDLVQREPASSSAEYLLAAFFVQQRRWSEAETVFKKISELGDSNPKQREALATFYVSMHQVDLAEKELLRIRGKYPDDVAAENALASLYVATNRAAEAEPLVAAVLKVVPDNADALMLRGRSLIQQNQIEPAISVLQHATLSDPQSVQAHYYLAVAELQNKQTMQAQAELQSVLVSQPDFVPARILLAGIKLDSGSIKAGMSDLDRIVSAKPDILGPYIARSVLQAQQGETSHAEKDLLPLLEQFPEAKDRALTLRALAWVMFNRNDHEAARKLLWQSSEAQPDSPENLYLLGLTYIAEKKTDTAFSTIDRSLKARPNWAEGYAVGGELAAMAERNHEAETYFEKAVSINPQLISAWQGLGVVLSAESNYDGALNAFGRVAQLLPRSGSAYFDIAQVQDLRGDWQQAQTSYRKVLELEPDNVIAKNNLAWSYAEHGGNIDLALGLAQEAHQAKPDDPQICDTLGWIYLKKNTPGAAIEAFRQSLTLQPKNPEYSYHLGMAYLRAGDTTKAKQQLEATVRMESASSVIPDAKKLLVSINETRN
ncbi:MAG TPA: tetratricopeptide repeat protein [Candidatus Sulfotelmatobacter sp.]|nr:tetratricopeptide repeat protein [Candidatus Sulfotelmatobacter sp.]